MVPHAAEHTGLTPEAATRYEMLRRHVLDPTVTPVGDLGLVVLMRHGMTAWARQQVALPLPPPPLPRHEILTPHPAQSQLTSLLVSMLIGSLDHHELKTL